MMPASFCRAKTFCQAKTFWQFLEFDCRRAHARGVLNP